MNKSIILLIIGVFLIVGVLVFFLTRHKKNTKDIIVGNKDTNVTVPVLISENGNYTMKPQDDANIVVYDNSGQYHWNSYLTNQKNFFQCNPVKSCKYTTKLQTDGDLVTYSDNKNINGTNITWRASDYPGTNFKKLSDSSAPYTLKLYNNGQLGIYDSNNSVIWSSKELPKNII